MKPPERPGQIQRSSSKAPLIPASIFLEISWPVLNSEIVHVLGVCPQHAQGFTRRSKVCFHHLRADMVLGTTLVKIVTPTPQEGREGGSLSPGKNNDHTMGGRGAASA